MLAINVTTTDQAFVEDLNSASIEGVTAEYRPTMAFDSTEHILQIVVTLVAPIAFKSFVDWIFFRYVKKGPSKQQIININIKNSHDSIVNICIKDTDTDTHAKDKD